MPLVGGLTVEYSDEFADGLVLHVPSVIALVVRRQDQRKRPVGDEEQRRRRNVVSVRGLTIEAPPADVAER